MKLKNSQIRLFLILIMVLTYFITNQYIVGHYNDMTDSIKSQEKEISAELSVLKAYSAKEEEYKYETEEARNKVNEIIGKYAGLYNFASEISMVIDLEKNLNVTIPNITFGTSTLVASERNLSIEEGNNVYLYKYPVTISYKTTYDGIKEMSDYFNASIYKKNIDSISMSYDSTTGILSGAMVINLYALDFGNGEYMESDFDDMNFGVENIFGTYR